MTHFVQTGILNATVSVVAQIKKTNAATIAIIDQRTVGVTNLMTMIAKNAGIVSLNNICTGSAPPDSMISGIGMTEPLSLATMTKRFIDDASIAEGGREGGAKGYWGCLKLDCPGWWSRAENKIVCPMVDNPECIARAKVARK